MTKPRLIYYQDAHHFHAKRLDPPVSMHMLQWPVDELLGTGADVLAFGLGYGDVYFHETKVGRVVGQYQEVWNGYIDWRIMRMVRDARALGTDQVRAVVERGHEMGLRVFPSLKLQSCDPPDSDRSGLLKWHHWKEVCLGEKNEFHPRLEYCYDYANPRVRDAKLAVLRELMEDYGVDGVELDFMFVPRFFKAGEEEKSAPIMSGFVAEIRGVADEVGQKQDRHIDVAARIFHRREHNLKLGLDPETWLKEKSIDIVVGQVTDQFLDTGVDARWLADAANSAGAAAYLRPPRRVYDERTTSPSIEMHRALSQTLSEQGFAGSYLANLPWPFAEKEHQILREAAYPGPNARQDKRYLLQPRESGLTFEELLDYTGQWKELPRRAEDEVTEPPDRQLPVALEEGKTARVHITVSDDLESARKDGEMRSPALTIRFSYYCVEDDIEVRFNGRVLPPEDAEISDERGLTIPVRPGRSQFTAPTGMSAHWFRYKLDPDLLRRGENTLEVEAKKMAPEAGFTRSINGVEVQTRYKDFVRPEGIEGVSRVAPQAG